MDITPNQPFRHGTVNYEQDKTTSVSDGLGMYFCSVGWAAPVWDTVPEDLRDELASFAPPATDQEVTLEVQDVTQNQGTETVK